MADSEIPQYSQITPAVDWYFVHDNAQEGEPPIVWRLAAWAINAEGKVIGLIGAFGQQQKGVPGLVSVPAVPGAYLHLDQLSVTETIESLKR